ncbi:MAG: FhaA domain-containing protein [Acidimicrobiia bacterium]
MNVVRNLERRLERLLDDVAGRFFSGRLHPSELAGKLAREADFARYQHATGPATANLYLIQVNPDDLAIDTEKLERMLAAEMTAYTSEEGLRLEGPIQVRIEASPKAASGRAGCRVEIAPGNPVVWARFSGDGETIDIGRNRVFVGRSPDCDVVIPHDDVSRRHALVYRQGGRAYLQDLNSANGSSVDGNRAGSQAMGLSDGSIVDLGAHRYRFVEV